MGSRLKRNPSQHASLQHSAALRWSVTLGQLSNMYRYLKGALEQAPENLIAFIDGRPLTSPEPSEPESGPVRKKRKLTGPDTSKILPLLSRTDDYLTLSRVDVTMVRLHSSSGAYTS